MILQRLIAGLGKQEWNVVAIEGLVLVGGIFAGLQINSWNDARQDRLSERHYLERIYEELAADIADIEEGIRAAESRAEMGRLLIAAVENPDLASVDPHAFFRAIEQAGYTYSPAISDYTFQELKNDGKIGIIRDADLRWALMRYYKLIENYSQWAYRREHFQNTYGDRKLGILTPEQSSKLEPYDADAEFTQEEALEALERMRARPGFVEQIYRASNHSQAISKYTEWRDSAEQLRGMIGVAIGYEDQS